MKVNTKSAIFKINKVFTLLNIYIGEVGSLPNLFQEISNITLFDIRRRHFKTSRSNYDVFKTNNVDGSESLAFQIPYLYIDVRKTYKNNKLKT